MRQDVLDNILGAIARMIFTAPRQIPLQTLVPDWMSRLPLYMDLEEGSTVLKALLVLLEI